MALANVTAQLASVFQIPNARVVPPLLHITILSLPAPLTKSNILSASLAVPLNMTTATAVKPPFVAMLNVCAPPSRYWLRARSNVTAPVPLGPAPLVKGAVAAYV